MHEMNLPVPWNSVQLEEIADVRAGSAFPIKYQGNIEGKYPFYKVSDMNLTGNETLMCASNNWVEENTVKTLKAKLFPKDTVIFPKVGAAVHTNKKRILSTNGLVDNNVMGVTIRNYNLCIPYYLLYWFEFIDLGDLSNPGPLPAITATTVKNTKIPLPPLPEQRAIAHVLQTIQEAKATRQREIELERERKAALMDDLFSHGTKGEPRKQTEIGEIPESWEVVRLGDYCYKPDYGYTESANDSPVGPKFLRITDIQNDAVNWENVPYCICSEEGKEKYLLKTGDIVIARIGATTGKAYIIDDCPEAIFASYLIRVRTKDKLLPIFLAQYFRTNNYWRQIDQSKGGRLKGGVNIPILSHLLLPLPHLSEQQQIAEILQACDTKITALEQAVKHLDELFHAMLDELMTGQRSAVPLIDAKIDTKPTTFVN